MSEEERKSGVVRANNLDHSKFAAAHDSRDT